MEREAAPGYRGVVGRLLILCGSAESAALARAVSDAGIEAVAHLTGDPREPAIDALPVVTSPLGRDAANRRRSMSELIERVGAEGVLAADHPFGAGAGAARLACGRRGLPFLRLCRAPWTPEEGDDWRAVPSGCGVMRAVPPGATLFAAAGPWVAERLAAHDGWVHCRRLDAEAPPYPHRNGAWCLGAGPFTVEGEAALFERLGIECLVTRNVGGEGAWPKVGAARRLGLPVVMIDMPPQPEPRVRTVEEALGWAKAR